MTEFDGATDHRKLADFPSWLLAALRHTVDEACRLADVSEVLPYGNYVTGEPLSGESACVRAMHEDETPHNIDDIAELTVKMYDACIKSDTGMSISVSFEVWDESILKTALANRCTSC